MSNAPAERLRWFDHHCHLPAAEASDDLVEAAVNAGVARLITVGTDVERSVEAAAVARRHRGVVFATAGIHPHEARLGGVVQLDALLDDDVVLAVGECGLDYYYDHSPRSVQRTVFAEQIELANRRSVPLVIHTRDAWDDTFDVLAETGTPQRVVFHCFSGGPTEAARCLDIGAHLSFSGIVTFKTADTLRDALRSCPLDRIMVETDAPYLAPVPFRGKRNEPAHVTYTAAAVAELKDVPVPELSELTWATTSRFYGVDPGPAVVDPRSAATDR